MQLPPATEEYPASQGVHIKDPAREDCPAGQFVQNSASGN